MLQELEMVKKDVGTLRAVCDVPDDHHGAPLMQHIEFGEYVDLHGRVYPVQKLGVSTIMRMARSEWQAIMLARMFA